MLELALFIGAHVAPLPQLPLNLRWAADAPASLHAARFIREGGLGEIHWVDLPLPEPLREPAPTPSMRVEARMGDQRVEVLAPRGAQYEGAITVGIERAKLGPLARAEGVLRLTGHLQRADGTWLTTRTTRVSSVGVAMGSATLTERISALAPGTPRATTRALIGAPERAEPHVDWYGEDMLIFDAQGRFKSWQRAGC